MRQMENEVACSLKLDALSEFVDRVNSVLARLSLCRQLMKKTFDKGADQSLLTGVILRKRTSWEKPS